MYNRVIWTARWRISLKVGLQNMHIPEIENSTTALQPLFITAQGWEPRQLERRRDKVSLTACSHRSFQPFCEELITHQSFTGCSIFSKERVIWVNTVFYEAHSTNTAHLIQDGFTSSDWALRRSGMIIKHARPFCITVWKPHKGNNKLHFEMNLCFIAKSYNQIFLFTEFDVYC